MCAEILPEERTAKQIDDARRTIRKRLRDYILRPAIQEALFIASPPLASEVAAWAAADGDEGKKTRKTELALVKYFTRMASRPTPFGLFSACTYGTIGGDRTGISYPSDGSLVRHTRLDMSRLAQLMHMIINDHEIASLLPCRPNETIRRCENRLHYVETTTVGHRRGYRLSAASTTDELESVLSAAAHGKTERELQAHVVETAEVTPEEAEDYIKQLLAAQLLKHEVGLAIYGDDSLESLLTTLQKVGYRGPMLKRLRAISEALRQLDKGGIGQPRAIYESIAELAISGTPSSTEASRLFQVDLLREAESASIGMRSVDALLAGTHALHQVMPVWADHLRRFRTDFVKRYDRQEVPLLEALDPEQGIGFYVDDSPLGYERALEHRNTQLLRRVVEVLHDGCSTLALNESDLESLAVPAPPLPDSFASVAVISLAPNANCAEDPEIFLAAAGGPSGAAMMGRFCHLSRRLHNSIKDYLRDEEAQNPDAIYAEVVHLPQDRMGNVISRPRLREFEIDYLGHSTTPRSRVIEPGDLMVSVQGEHVQLRSRNHGRVVIPRLTTAHNFAAPQNLPLYRFLGGLQRQEHAGAAWNWGRLSALPHLPRVTWNNVVFAREQWSPNTTQLARLVKEPAHIRYKRAVRWQKDIGIPDLCVYADNDSEILIDWTNPLSVDALLQMVRQHRGGRFLEVYPLPSRHIASDNKGVFHCEVVVPFAKDQRKSNAPVQKLRVSSKSIARVFPPGSDWLYVKIYTWPSAGEDVLLRDLAPVIARAIDSGAVTRWHFIRYRDPDPHLRVRLYGDRAQVHGELSRELLARLERRVEGGSIWTVQIDTYRRELERYGGADGMEMAESLFHVDSDAVISLLRIYSGDERRSLREVVAYKAIDDTFRSCGVTGAAKLALLAGFSKVEEALRRSSSEEYRKMRPDIEMILNGRPEPASRYGGGISVLRERRRRLQGLVVESSATQQACVRDNILDFTHMFLNRLIPDITHAQERRFYHFLWRHHRSVVARQRQAGAGNAASERGS